MIITHKQLAFILDIEAIEALGKIIFAHCKERKQDIPPQKTKPYKVTDYKNMGLPQEIALDVLEKHTGLKLGSAILDISENYLKRPASKKWILCDFPEKDNRGKQRNLDSKRSGECADYKFKDTFFYSSDVKDWYESKSKIVAKSPNLF